MDDGDTIEGGAIDAEGIARKAKSLNPIAGRAERDRLTPCNRSALYVWGQRELVARNVVSLRAGPPFRG
jgi:hypothetical protein